MLYDLVLHMFVSESIQIVDDICDFCRLFGSAPYCYQVLPDLFEILKSFADASKVVDFIGGAPTSSNFVQNLLETYYIRVRQ